MLESSPTAGAEEYAVFDYEGFGPWRLGEYESIETIAAVANGIDEFGPAFAHYVALRGTDEDTSLPTSRTPTSVTTKASRPTPRSCLRTADLDPGAPRARTGYVHLDVAAYARDLELGGDIERQRRRRRCLPLLCLGPERKFRCGMGNEGVRFRILPGRMYFSTRNQKHGRTPIAVPWDRPSGAPTIPQPEHEDPRCRYRRTQLHHLPHRDGLVQSTPTRQAGSDRRDPAACLPARSLRLLVTSPRTTCPSTRPTCAPSIPICPTPPSSASADTLRDVLSELGLSLANLLRGACP